MKNILLVCALVLGSVSLLSAQDTLMVEKGYQYVVLQEGTGASPQLGQEVEYKVKMYNPLNGEVMMESKDLGYNFFDIIDEENAMEWGTFGKMKVGATHLNMISKDLIDDPYMLTMPGDLLIGEITLINVMDAKPYGSDMLAKLIDTDGLEAAKAKYAAIQTKGTQDIVFREDQMNSLGYSYLAQENIEAGLIILTWNAELHPNSFNVYDSLGDAQMAAGQKEAAKPSYEKALSLNSNLAHTKEKLAKMK